MNDKPISESWEKTERDLFSPSEIAVSHARAKIVSDLIRYRQKKKLSQKKLEILSGVRQPIIARMEAGQTSPHIDTVLRALYPLGKTLAVVSLPRKKKE